MARQGTTPASWLTRTYLKGDLAGFPPESYIYMVLLVPWEARRLTWLCPAAILDVLDTLGLRISLGRDRRDPPQGLGLIHFKNGSSF